MAFDDILAHVGEYGRYQQVITLLLYLPCMFTGMQGLSYVFTSAIPKYRCYVNGCDSSTTSYCEDFLNFTIPFVREDNTYNECEQYEEKNATKFSCNESYFNNITRNCDNWKFDDAVYLETTVSKWNLVCNKTHLVALSQSLYMVGIMLGSVLFGIMADRLGRKNTLLVSLLIGVTTATVLPFLPYYSVFLIFKVFTGIAFQGLYQTAFVMSIEIVGRSKRAFCGMIASVFFAFGEIILGILAYFVRDWENLQLIISVPPIIFIVYYWILPESPRWLLSRQDIPGAKKVLERIALSNKTTLPFDVLNVNEVDVIAKNVDGTESSSFPNNGARKSALDLFRTPRLRWRSINIFLNWFMNTVAYYGITMSTPSLGGNEFWNFVIISAVEVPSYLFGMLVLDRFGRRLPLCCCMIVGGIAGTCNALVPSSSDYYWLSITLAMIGKFGASAAFGIIYVFSAELFPTVIRNNGIGLSSLIGHIGGVIAPYIANLSSVSYALPLVIFGAFSLASGIIAITLPETLGRTLPETVEDAENFGRLDASGGEDLERVRLLSNQGADSLAQEEMSDID